MTPRGVQVWFQNRRAKTKQQAKKAEAATSSSAKSPDPAATAPAASANPPIAPNPDADEGEDEDEDDVEDAEEPSLAVPPSPLPIQSSEDASAEVVATADGAPANANASAVQDNEQSNSTSDSRRGSLAEGWSPAASPSVSTAPASSLTAPSSALGSPNPANHVNSSHVRLLTHPPSVASSYSHNHLAPTEIYSQRRTSLPPSLSFNGLGAGMGIGMPGGLRRRGGYDPNARRRSTDMGGHRIVAHPYISVAQSANGPHHLYPDGEGNLQQSGRRPMLAQRASAPFVSSLHGPNAQAMHSPQLQGHHLHAHSHLILPSHVQQRAHLAPRPHYELTPAQLSASHSQGYNQPPTIHHGYDLFAPRHSIDGSALGLTQAHAQMSLGVSPLHGAHDAYIGLGMPSGNYAISQRPDPASIPGPLPSPNFSFGNPFAPSDGSSSSSTSNSASGTPPNLASPPLLSLRRTSESAISDGDTEESSGAPLSRFGSIASVGGSEGSWTSAYVSDNGVEGDEGGICASRRPSCASEFLGMFSDMEVGSNGGTPAPHGMPDHHPLRHASSSSHLSPNAYAAHHAQVQVHSPDGQQSHVHIPSDGDGYPSPSSASTVSAGSNSDQHAMSHDTIQQQQQPASETRLQGSNHPRTSTSSELAYALHGEPEYAHAYPEQLSQASSSGDDDTAQLQYPMYGQQHQYSQSDSGDGDQLAYGYAQDQGHYVKGQVNPFPTLYEGYVYSHSGPDGGIPEEETSAMNQAGAIELSHMCVPASEGVHFMGGYAQYS
ncbi:hypothetical protein BC628DRAFT_1314367 [Trametes gibbosa]|nr:hypothetical protein BC628DRAFT_1314367 [Trametes gibbosa]